MKLETITAPTMQEALQAVRRALGEEAVILQTRTVTRKRWLGLRTSEHVEVTASKSMNVPRRMPPKSQPAREAVMKQVAPNRAATEYAQAGSAPRPAQGLLESPAVSTVAIVGLQTEIGQLKSCVTQLVREVRSSSAPQVPEQLFQHYLDLTQAEVSDEVARDIVRTVQQNARPEQLAQPEYVRERVLDQIEKLIPLAQPITRKKLTGPHVVALVGPTGVGKTTTVAKLAANLRLREGRRVGLITLDTYRIAAIDQLRKYAELIGVPLQVVGSTDDMRATIASMQECEYILIDTAGRSPTDHLKLGELAQFLQSAEPDEVFMVLSSSCSPKSAQFAVERFSQVRIDKVIFTKIDEAAQLGVVLQVALKLNKGIAYVTTGQDVPDDIEASHGRKLAKLILEKHG